MNLKGLERSLDQISEELKSIEERREKILKESRDIITFSAKAIVDLHTANMREAKHYLRSASTLLVGLRRVASGELRRYLVQPETEYVEASILYAVALNREFPPCEKLGVCGAAYLLGLLDVIGEIKRKVYDTIRKGEGGEATSLFSLMEQIYVQISPYAAYDRVAPGLKRKLDVARILIEDTRSAVTEETRRLKFIEAVEELSNKIPPQSVKETSNL